MTRQKLERKIWEILPDANFEFDNQGQLVIYTGLTTDNSDNLIEHTVNPEDEDE